ncbi:MAG TPA: hypothetical protein VFU74_16200 [Actinocrinis sp.]|nr:hypothetical protein [Actinocrinis sp.]
MSINRRGLAVLAALLAGLSAGCASSTAQHANAMRPGQVATTPPGAKTGVGHAFMMQPGTNCPSTSTDPAIAKLRAGVKQVALPPDFHPIAVIRCESPIRMVPGDGEWQFADAQRADSGLADLLADLRLPSQTRSPDTACPAMALSMEPFALVDTSGRVISPLLPTSMCGFPLPQVTNAINALPWRTETEQRLHQTRTQAEIDTGCSSQYKYMFDHPVTGTPEPWSKVRRPMNPAPAAVCGYTVEPPSAGDYITVGSFTHGAKLTAAQQAAVATELGNASQAPAPACAVKATRFASLEGPGAGLLVELDGCKRILWPNDFMSTAPATLSQLITSLTHG